EKVRVKFIRNYPDDASENTEEKKLGRAMVRLGSGEGSLKELKQNVALLGYVLSGQVPEASSFLASNPAALHKETLSVAQSIVESLKLEGSEELLKSLQEAVEKSSKSNAIQSLLENSVKASVQKFEPKLLADYGESYQEWAKKFEAAVQRQLELQTVEERKASIQKTLSELEAKRQNLWFFENRDDIDIQIYKKKVYYPKRWFGKKKKPKAADTFYVPPTITHNG
ncbi:GM17853, partial [Drosophila sechellia]